MICFRPSKLTCRYRLPCRCDIDPGRHEFINTLRARQNGYQFTNFKIIFLNEIFFISWENGLARNRRQAIILTDDGLIYRRMYESLYLDWSINFIMINEQFYQLSSHQWLGNVFYKIYTFLKNKIGHQLGRDGLESLYNMVNLSKTHNSTPCLAHNGEMRKTFCLKFYIYMYRTDSRFAPGQWERVLHDIFWVQSFKTTAEFHGLLIAVYLIPWTTLVFG